MKGLSLFLVTVASVQAQVFIPRFETVPEDLAPQPTLIKREDFQEPCAAVSASWAAYQAASTSESPMVAKVPAKVAHDCLQSVPLDQEGNLKQVEEFKHFLQFHSTTSWLKEGIEGQIEPLDIYGRLDEITEKLKRREGGFQSEYEYQLELEALFVSGQDFHLRWSSDIHEVLLFSRKSGFLVSLSKDGISVPQVYLAQDVLEAENSTDPLSKISPIKTINGVDVVKYLEGLSNQTSYHDADARYNKLFINRPRLSAGLVEAAPWGQGGLYDGPSTEFVFINGTKLTQENEAIIGENFDLTNVIDGQSFFDTFCSGSFVLPEQKETTPPPTPSQNETSLNTTTPVLLPINYPYPVFVQSSRAFHGYYLNDTKYTDVAVLAIPDFGPKKADDIFEGAKETQELLRTFFKQATEEKKTKLVIDLRGNGGGTIDMGFEMFKQLFPTIEPYGASRYRVHDAFSIHSAGIADLVANESVKYTDMDIYELAKRTTVNWANILNVDHKPFKSFEEYCGPYTINNDNFTAIRRYNFSNDEGGHTTAGGFHLTGYGFMPTPPQPFKTENIVIIQDGGCGSTCAIFSELMREQVKVHTVFVGGRPQNAPAQGVGGSKGSQVLSFDGIVSLMNGTMTAAIEVYGEEMAREVNKTAVGSILASTQLKKRSAHYNGEDMNGAVNSLNNYRQGDTTDTPLEFVYEAADCRLFDTVESFFSPVPLWKRVVDAKWGDGKCAEGSMGHKTAISVVDGKPFNSKQGNVTAPAEHTGSASNPRWSGVMTIVTTLMVAVFMM